MKYKLTLKQGLKLFGETEIEVDPNVILPIEPDEADEEYERDRQVRECHETMFEIEKAINANTSLRAHVEFIEEDEWKKKVRTEKNGIVINPPTKEGKKHHKELEKKWKKMEKKHSKKGRK